MVSQHKETPEILEYTNETESKQEIQFYLHLVQNTWSRQEQLPI